MTETFVQLAPDGTGKKIDQFDPGNQQLRQAIVIASPTVIGNAVEPTAGGEMPVHAASLPLPTGAAQDSSLATLHTDLGTTIHGDLTTLHSDLGTVATDIVQVHTDVGTTLHADLGQLHTDLIAPLPAGSNAIGQVTANAGTNLNTSALALESGGNLATVVSNQGTDGSPTQDYSGTGIRGWLAGIYQRLKGTLNVSDAGGSITVDTGTPGTFSVTAPSTFFSSTANLAPAASYQTGWIDTGTNGFGFSITLTADQPVTFLIQDSPDNGSTVRTLDTDTIAAGVTFNETHIAYSRYVQLTFTNAGSSSTTSVFINVTQRPSLPPEATCLTDRYGNDVGVTNNALNVTGSVSVSETGSLTVDTGSPGQPLKTVDQGIAAAQTSDAPLFTAITGDPNGDFAGVNLLEAAIAGQDGLNVHVNVDNQAKTDPRTGATVLSDAPQVWYGSGTTAGQIIVGPIDTRNYQEIVIQIITGGTAVAAFQGSVDGSVWPAGNTGNILGYLSSGAAGGLNQTIASSTAAAMYYVPCSSQFFRMQIFTTGTNLAVSVSLRQTPVTMSMSNPSFNIAQVAGVTTNASPGGALTVAGATAQGAVQSGNSVPIGGVDSNTLFRRILTDTAGAQVAVGSPNPTSVPVMVAQTINTETGVSLYQSQQQIVQLLTAIAFYLKEGFGSPHEPAEFNNDTSLLN